ncbi:DUF6681 family protein [Secundilactobacillus paracollinoides]|uniref:DUF6681 family protein n=1 Tax=Secundilactobacillus paracollinoides TaxID=240427 RepID=UPI00081C2A16|nr:DUF6681 family protein [Secundilactobacillus paracollinoides]
MFSLLDMINHYLGYFNINTKLKNRIYTIIGAFGTIYLIYVATRWIHNGYWLRGFGILLVGLILAYFTVMNVFYYFTTKKPPFDISPKIEKLMGKPFGSDPAAEANQQEAANAQQQMGNGLLNSIPANGYFDAKKVLPGKVKVTLTQQRNIDELAAHLQQLSLMQPDYSGLGQREIAMQIEKQHKPIYAIGLGVNIPYFELSHQGNDLVVLAGVNQSQKVEVGTVTTVGLQSINDIQDRVKLYLANVILVGGPYMEMGRNMPMEKQAPYAIRVQLAYEKQGEEKTDTQPTSQQPLSSTARAYQSDNGASQLYSRERNSRATASQSDRSTQYGSSDERDDSNQTNDEPTRMSRFRH